MRVNIPRLLQAPKPIVPYSRPFSFACLSASLTHHPRGRAYDDLVTIRRSLSSSSKHTTMSSPPPDSPSILPQPALDARWVHAGAQHLDLLATPVTAQSTTYLAFSADESDNIDHAWWSRYDDKQRQAIRKQFGVTEKDPKDSKASKEKDEKRSSKDLSNGKQVYKEADEDLSLERDKHGRTAEEIEKAKDDVIRSGEEQPREDNEEAKIREEMESNEDLETIKGIPVSQDGLFEVSLDNLSLHPVFWAHSGPRIPVLRGTWFAGDEQHPCDWELADELERAYLEIKPWQPSYKHELATATALGSAAEEKLKYNLPARFGQGLGIIFEDGQCGRLYQNGGLTSLSRAFWSTLRTKPSGSYVYRGYEAALAASGSSSKPRSRAGSSTAGSRRGSSNSQRPHVTKPEGSTESKRRSLVFSDDEGDTPTRKNVVDNVKEKLDKINEKGKDTRKALEEEQVPVTMSKDSDLPCTDLILVIHGIGQQLAVNMESFNFVYAGNQLRQVLKKQAGNPALASIIRDRRVQILPIQWRASMRLEDEINDEDRAHGMDNRFSMADVTLNKSIPYVRELTNSVLLDIPLFMSQHRQKMIEAVCLQANRAYRMWCARNPDFEQRNGKVHIVGHSLGSALAAHILSNQPTRMPPMAQLPKQVIRTTRDRFLFNTSNLFLCGSPLGIFLHLDQAQLMPRKGRERTMNSPMDEALERAGRFGCMSVDSLYNIFVPTDPIAYALNAAVDSKLAKTRQPLAITAVTEPFFASVTEGISSMSRYIPFIGGADDKKKRPNVKRLPSGIEMSGPDGQERLEGSRAERRFSALNRHGTVDFYLPSAGVSEYLEMITAHASYWTDPSFAAFLLAEIFSTRLDLMRTGMGLAEQTLPEGVSL